MAEGDSVSFDKVLLIDDDGKVQVGAPINKPDYAYDIFLPGSFLI
jgi:ribosomal protein L21